MTIREVIATLEAARQTRHIADSTINEMCKVLGDSIGVGRHYSRGLCIDVMFDPLLGFCVDYTALTFIDPDYELAELQVEVINGGQPT
jgi:hypothetical protein